MRFNRNDENYVYGFVGKNIKKYRKLKGLTRNLNTFETQKFHKPL